ncbi:MAG: CBS domain-containing protein [Deltaproteobacteria bacterium]|jgi:CBS domain-containing protein|nr:CBS domain-containing protein [Deltaproteobacteria bacterium]
MKVRDICTRQVVTMFDDGTVLDAARLMRAHHVGDVIVLRAPDESPIGIVTDRDIVVGAVALGVSDLASIFVRDLITRDLVTVNDDDDVFTAMEIMWPHGVRRIPVLGADGRLSGILTYDDLVHRISEQLADLTRTVKRQVEREKALRVGT